MVLRVSDPVCLFGFYLQHKWKCEILAKNAEIEQYREELDSLLAALRVLQQQGTSPATHVL